MNDSVKSVIGSAKSRLDHDGKQPRSTVNVQNDCL